ncbi:MAG: hypothetical protein OEY59_00715 [Deltaproteobacteria bacterium]|nr:hypothetical protein [Deltaproteobacteria bacterium]
MFNLSKKKEAKYLYLLPGPDDLAQWEVLNEEELEKRVKENRLEEGCKLFKIEQEVNIRFEKIIHLD